MSSVYPLLAEIVRSYVGTGVVRLILTTFEILNSREETPLKGRAFGLISWLFYVPALSIAQWFLGDFCRWLGVTPLITVPAYDLVSGFGVLGGICAVLISGIITDFVFYWYHRAQHRWLWRLHAVHHSIKDLNAVNSFHHISETVTYMIVMLITLKLIVSETGPAIPYMALVLWLKSVWIHSPTKAHFGPLRILLVDNRFHRIHHSIEPGYHDRNFGAFTTLWDRVFGTAYFPQRDEWPAVGVSKLSQPRSIPDWLGQPWSRAHDSTRPVSPDTIRAEARADILANGG